MKLREEAVAEEGGEKIARTWDAVIDEWRGWMKEYKRSSSVFRDTWTGEEFLAPMENRYMEERRERLYAKLCDMESGIKEAYGDLLHTVMLTFTASTTSGAGDWERCPANHLDDLLGSWSAVRRSLSRVLDGREWEYARIQEPHESGYAHVHVAVFVKGPVEAEDFAPVMEAHVENCLPAASEAHRVEGEDAAVSVKRGIDNLSGYVSAYIGGWDTDPLEAEEKEQAFNALLWATNKRRVSFSQGAKEHMAYEPPEVDPDRYELTHFERGEERYPNNYEGEGVVLERIDGEAGLDPPPERD